MYCKPNCFKQINVFETGLSGFHLVTMKKLGRISSNLILALVIWKVSTIQSSCLKALHKAIMKICNLRKKSLELKTFSDRKAYTFQRNFCKKLLRNTKRTWTKNNEMRVWAHVDMVKFLRYRFQCCKTRLEFEEPLEKTLEDGWQRLVY